MTSCENGGGGLQCRLQGGLARTSTPRIIFVLLVASTFLCRATSADAEIPEDERHHVQEEEEDSGEVPRQALLRLLLTKRASRAVAAPPVPRDLWGWHGHRPHGHSPCPAGAQCYLNRYGDLRRAFGSRNTARACTHWHQYGYRENRMWGCCASGSRKHARCYLDRYADLKRAFGRHEGRACYHWHEYGAKERRKYTCHTHHAHHPARFCFINFVAIRKNGFGTFLLADVFLC